MRADAPPVRDEPAVGASRTLVVARIAVPVALAVVGVAVLAGERWQVSHELQLVAPEAVRPGDPIPMRAFVFVGARDGGSLEPATVAVEIVRDGRRVDRVVLAPSATGTAEGRFESAGANEGEVLLRAHARDADGAVVATLERPLRIARAAPPSPLVGRLAGALQHLALGPIVPESPEIAAPAIDLRVVGGACVPEQPCELLVQAPGVDSFAVEETAAATVAGGSHQDTLHRIEVVTHGPEAAITLIAARAGRPIARAEVRLPIALATPWIEAPRRAEGEVVLQIVPPPGRGPVIVDDFVEGRWAATITLEPGRAVLRDLAPGLHRLQARADPFGGDAVLARYVLVDDELENVRELLAAEGVALPDPAGTHPLFLLAGAEQELRALPAAVSGYEADVARVAERLRRLHLVGAVALALGIVVFAITLLRRSLSAAAEAREVMRAAGDERAGTSGARVRMTIEVVAGVGAAVLALLAGAALILARAALLAP